MNNTVFFSKKFEYGLQATLNLAANPDREAIPVEEINKQLQVRGFASKNPSPSEPRLVPNQVYLSTFEFSGPVPVLFYTSIIAIFEAKEDDIHYIYFSRASVKLPAFVDLINIYSGLICRPQFRGSVHYLAGDLNYARYFCNMKILK